jgi:hypothetical protein
MIIYNKYIPFKGFKAMAIFPFVFVRGDKVSEKTLRHERIHFRQQFELFILGFYLLYIGFYLAKGYKNNPFEKEAYQNDDNKNYLKERRLFSWIKYINHG